MVLSGVVYFKLSQAELKELHEKNMALTIATTMQDDAITDLEEINKKSQAAYQVIIEANSKIEAEKERYLEIFKRHNLTRLAAAKPGLIETRINKGTKDVFDSIEKASAWTIDTVD
jgi:predicted nucleotide-binding protein (sugar kinase/HSP70/actin superfamily)|tara:strand:- start:4736 stop:5083 length:348 start_codon:yes stop_codon:yes gene_type:complete